MRSPEDDVLEPFVRSLDSDFDFADASRPRVRQQSGEPRRGAASPRLERLQPDHQAREPRAASVADPGRRLVAPVHRLTRGTFDVHSIVEDSAHSLGLLVLDGLIAVGLDAGRAQVSWLIGSDDLIRPWDLPEISLTQDTSWYALTNVRIAVLDEAFSRRASETPAVARALVVKTTRTSHWLLAQSLIISAPVVSDRLLLLFALLAERWGKVTPDGVRLELSLTHDMLARLSGARRPSVSIALRSLGAAGLVESVHRGSWLLHGVPASQPPGWTANPCWRRYADAIGFADTTARSDQPPHASLPNRRSRRRDAPA